MMKRKAFRPTSFDCLEQRLVMNGQVPAAHGPVTVGAIGDSYSDEYQFYPIRNHARNWVEQLSDAHKVSFGPFTRGSRGEPRNQGYIQDWARSGATSSDMIANQLPGLTQQVAAGQVKYVSVFVGADDFIHYLEAAAVNPPTSLQVASTQLNQIASTVSANINQAVTTLLAANSNVKVVVATIPSVSTFPVARLFASNPQAQSLFAEVDQAVSQVNAQIRAAALSPRVAVSDLAAQGNQLAAGSSTRIGGATINLTTAGNDYHSFFLADGLHAGTVGQGLIANSFINAIDAKFGARVSGLTERQIINEASQIQRRTRNLLP